MHIATRLTNLKPQDNDVSCDHRICGITRFCCQWGANVCLCYLFTSHSIFLLLDNHHAYSVCRPLPVGQFIQVHASYHTSILVLFSGTLTIIDKLTTLLWSSNLVQYCDKSIITGFVKFFHCGNVRLEQILMATEHHAQHRYVQK